MKNSPYFVKFDFFPNCKFYPHSGNTAYFLKPGSQREICLDRVLFGDEA
jgi:hypothetical protein